LDKVIIQKIQYEIEQIDELIKDSIPVYNLCKVREPDFVEKCGVALILQSFYNGIENIVLMIIKNKDSKLPNDSKWHKELLSKAFEKTENRSEIFKEEIRIQLNDYLQFRHIARHSYGFKLNWGKMKHLLFEMNIMWNNVKDNLRIFLENN
jgi:hypothetical protein